MMDLDHFKPVNDEYGHLIGDRVLVETALLLREYSRESDCIGRWGGEEFMIVSQETGLSGLLDHAEKIRNAIDLFTFSEVSHISVSIGVAAYQPGDTAGDLVGRADQALYQAKSAGRNRVDFA
jgi:diguanylate cyclase (GGDEF)-like protein